MYAKLKKFLVFHKDGLEALKLIHEVDSSAIPITLLKALVSALYPYIYLFLGAEIIDALIENNFEMAIGATICLIGGNFIFGVLRDLLEQIDEYRKNRVWHLTSVLIRKKALEIDFETLEDAKTLEKINSAIYASSQGGGFGALLNCYCGIFEALFAVLTSIVLVIYLCFQTSNQAVGLIALITSIPFSIIGLTLFLGLAIKSNFIVAKYSNKKSLKLFQKELNAERVVGYFLNQVFLDYEKAKMIKLYNMGEIVQRRFMRSTQVIKSVDEERFQVAHFQGDSQVLISGISLMFSYVFVLLKVVIGAITIGELTKYVGAITKLNGAMMQMVQFNEQIRLQCDYLKKMTEFMQLENKRETGSIPIEKRLDNEYEIAFHNVSFAYPGSEEMILKNVSCTINMKDKLAVVGQNGAGKTTFIKLITRLYDPTEGSITLNGVDIRKYDYKEYLRLFGVVFQDFSLFAFQVEQNVSASTMPDAEKVWQMLELAGVRERIEEMPLQLKTPLFKYDEGGVDCSGGERQKLAIARALYKDAPFVILDEPTAALDPISEYEIYSRFHELVKDKTSIYISHRMSSCRFCDDILVFDKGRIAQRGSHDELMIDKEQLYASLWNAQASYYAS